MQIKIKIVIIFSLFLVGCGSNYNVKQAAVKSGFKHVVIRTNPFALASQQKILDPNAPINIYIEGDGNAWVSRSRISSDPSPNNPTAMALATLDPSPNVVYLARPCQNSPQDLASVCNPKYWTNARYSDTVVTSMNQAIGKIRSLSKARKVNLIGYSGGATIAVLIAARRNDVASIRTVAGNLDLESMQRHHNTSPLDESLDPINVASKVKHIPQVHFVGGKDRVVPEFVARKFQRAAGLTNKQVVTLKGVSHQHGWTEKWRQLLKNVP